MKIIRKIFKKNIKIDVQQIKTVEVRKVVPVPEPHESVIVVSTKRGKTFIEPLIS